jgi:predicted ATPase
MEGLLTFDPGKREWRWDSDQIAARGITANVADLLSGKLDRFGESTKRILSYLAALGSGVDATVLGLVLQTSEDEVHAALREVLYTGLVQRQGNWYSFAHDRVQEAAYALVPHAERPAVHLAIGRALQTRSDPGEWEVFEIVSHLNRGAALITDEDERTQLVHLNHIASKRAKASSAYEAAMSYAVSGRMLMPGDAWERQYKLIFGLELNRAECEFLTGGLRAAEERLRALTRRAEGPVDLAAVVWIATAMYVAMGRHDQAVDMCLSYLRRIGIDWSPRPTFDQVCDEYREMWRQLEGRQIEDLIDLPVMTDATHRATMDVLAALEAAAYFVDPNLSVQLIARMASLSLAHGNCGASAMAYSLLGGFSARALGPAKRGCASGGSHSIW